MNKRQRELIFIALGEASMCWSETPTGVFLSDKCLAVGEKLYEELNLVHEREQK